LKEFLRKFSKKDSNPYLPIALSFWFLLFLLKKTATFPTLLIVSPAPNPQTGVLVIISKFFIALAGSYR